jgi:polar amino acid transport system permease protein
MDNLSASAGPGALAEWFQNLHESGGLNLSYLYDSFDQARLLHGLALTIGMALATLVASVIIGVLGAWLQMSRHALVRNLVSGFISVFRNTPPLVQIYFMYFGLGYFLTTDVDGRSLPLFSNIQWAIFSLALFGGAFNIEIFRSGIDSVGKGVKEAAASMGLSPWRTFHLVIMPLAVRNCLPSLGNNMVELIKTTSLAYAIAVPELMYNAKQIWGDSTNVPEMMFTVLFIYVALTTSLAGAFSVLERILRVPGLHGRRN